MNSEKSLERMVLDSKVRVTKSLKIVTKFSHLNHTTTNTVLRQFISKRISMCTLFVDLTGSTILSSKMRPKRFANIIKNFAQEISFAIEFHNGHVLKYVGDCVIGYFLVNTSRKKVINDAVSCTNTILNIVENGINPALMARNLPGICVHIGADYGKNNAVLYGSDRKHSHIDLIGLTMNLASKMQGIAGPNQVVIGEHVFNNLTIEQKKSFRKITDKKRWKYYHLEHRRDYFVYETKIRNDNKK